MTKLYIVEGLPCAGKSSVARFIAQTLETRSVSVRCVDEGTGDHPADYECHAFVDGRIIPLTDFSPEGLSRKIYDGLSWEVEAPLMLDKWRQYVQTARPGTTDVFNCVLLQNPMCETMMRFNMPEAESAAHIRRIAEIIAPLEPVVVYLHISDVAQRVRTVAQERPGWLDAVIPYHTEGGYGRSIGAEGFEGYIACLMERQRREERILQSLSLRSVTLTDAHRDWDGAKVQLIRQLTKEE